MLHMLQAINSRIRNAYQLIFVTSSIIACALCLLWIVPLVYKRLTARHAGESVTSSIHRRPTTTVELLDFLLMFSAVLAATVWFCFGLVLIGWIVSYQDSTVLFSSEFLSALGIVGISGFYIVEVIDTCVTWSVSNLTHCWSFR